MEIIPAIDILDGKCVRLEQGDFSKRTVFAHDPVEIARRWEDEGAHRLHIVDLEGSRAGAPREADVIGRICRAVGIPVEVGGGIRSLNTALQMLDRGVERVVIGTSAALDPETAETVFSQLGERAVLGVDARDGYVAIKGWEETTRENAVDFAVRMQTLGACRIIYTDISRDGMLKGVNIPAVRRMAKSLNIPVIASGGVSSLEDIRNLKEIEYLGVEGAILGKALYTGDLKLAEVLAL